jgi:RNA-binding protein
MRLNEKLSSGEGETSQKKMKELKSRSVEKKPTVWIGKGGVTDALLGQIRRQLDANEMVKVRVHKTSLEGTEVAKLADKIAEGTTSEIVDVRGRTFTIYKRKKIRKTGPKRTM